MSTYKKPLKNGGHRLIPRSSDGRFTRFSLGADICKNNGCFAIILPEFKQNDGLISKVWPSKCPQCGGDFNN